MMAKIDIAGFTLANDHRFHRARRWQHWLAAVLALASFALIAAAAPRAHAQAVPADALLDRINQLFQQEQHLAALPLAEEHVAKALARDGQGSLAHAEALLVLGEGLLWASQLSRAEQVLTHAKEFLERRLDVARVPLAGAHSILGLVQKYRGNFRNAEDHYKTSIRLLQEEAQPDHARIAADLNNLAELYRENGRFPEGEANHRDALRIWEQAAADSLDVAESLNNLGLLYHNWDRLDDAARLLERAVAIRGRLLSPTHPRLATTLNNLGLVQRSRGDNAAALLAIERAIGIWKASLPPQHPRIGIGLHNVADAERALGRLEASRRHFEEALAIFEHNYGLDHPNVATLLNNLGQVYRQQSAFAEAAASFARSIEIWGRAVGREHPRVAVVLGNLAQTYRELGQWDDALETSRQASRTGIRLARFNQSTNAAAGTRVLAGHRERVLEHVRLLWAARQRSLAGQTPEAADAIENEAFVAAQWAQSSEAAASLTQMAARTALQGGALSELVRERQDLAGRRQTIDRELLAAVSLAADRRNATDEAAHRNRLADIEVRLSEIDRELARTFPEYTALTSPEPLSIRAVQAELATTEALVLTIELPEGGGSPEATFIWVLTREKALWLRSDLGTGALTQQIAALRRSLDPSRGGTRGALPGATSNADTAGFDNAQAHALYAGLLGGADSLIREKPQLIVIASGALTALPMHVLLTEPAAAATTAAPEPTPWLMRRHAVTTQPSIASLSALRRARRADPAPRPFIAFADPAFRRGAPSASPRAPGAQVQAGGTDAAMPVRGGIADFFRGGRADAAKIASLVPLPDTADEVRQVAATLGPGAELRIGADATESEVKRMALGDFRIVHFATHGLVAGEITGLAEPALALTAPETASETDDGLLTATEIAALKLNADWVILSACNTAAGDRPGAEALSGLARAFFYAGARSLLVSHWPVRSSAAVKLTTRTFAEINRTPGIGRAEALRRAMLTLADGTDARDAHPSSWAPFVVVGEGGGR